jgi:aminoglycoside 3-N-acetyltransferase I
MSKPASAIRHLSFTDVPRLRELNALFGSAFDDTETYNGDPPSDAISQSYSASRM